MRLVIGDALADAAVVIAADGGANWLASVGTTPDRLVGDLDSADPQVVRELSEAGVAIDRHPTDKDASDLELAVSAALAAGADDIVILGALGGDLDHLTANLLLLGSEQVAGRQVRLVHDRTTARLLRGPDRLEIAAPAGSRVSLFAVGEPAEGVTTQGLQWPLADARLEGGSSYGLANVVSEPPAVVEVRGGRLLVIEIAPDVETPKQEEVEA